MEQYPDKVERLLERRGLSILAESLRECPHKTGYLRGTAAMNGPVVSNGRAYLSIGYGADYAIYVHERLDLTHRPPTKARFLADPMNRNQPILASELVELMDKLIEQSAGAEYHFGFGFSADRPTRMSEEDYWAAGIAPSRTNPESGEDV